MLNNNLLESKLNDFRKNPKPVSDNIPNDIQEPPITQAVTGFVFIFKLMIFLVRAFMLGFALKSIFNPPWNFWEYFSIGFTVNYIINSIAIFFNKQL